MGSVKQSPEFPDFTIEFFEEFLVMRKSCFLNIVDDFISRLFIKVVEKLYCYLLKTEPEIFQSCCKRFMQR